MRRLSVTLVIACAGAAGCGTVLAISDDTDTPSPDGGTEASSDGPHDDAAVDQSTDAIDGRADADVGAGLLHRVFVTSTTHPGSLLGAEPDAPCSSAAGNASLPGKFVAWLSFTGAAASVRLAEYGPWFTTHGELVASDKTDLTNGSIGAPIGYDEKGTPATGLVWTGTSAGGFTKSNCSNWTGGAINGTLGNTTQTGPQWTEDAPTGNCVSTFRVYCFQQP